MGLCGRASSNFEDYGKQTHGEQMHGEQMHGEQMHVEQMHGDFTPEGKQAQ